VNFAASAATAARRCARARAAVCAGLALVTIAAPAGMSSAAAAGSAAARATPVTDVMTLRPMPAGHVWFGRLPGGRLSVRADMFGLTPGSRHDVDLVMPGRHRSVRFRPLLASSAGQASSTLPSRYTGRVPAGSRLVIRGPPGFAVRDGGRTACTRSK
jgi:hypothetical protein